MRIAFELSGEHPTLPRADVLGALEAEGVALRKITFTPELLIVDALRPPRRALERVSLCRFVDRVLAIGSWSAILRVAARIPLAGETFRVRAHGQFSPAEKPDRERQVGGAMDPRGRVDLGDPDRDFRVLHHGGALLLGEGLVER